MLPINVWFSHLIKLANYSLEFNDFAVQTRPHQIPFLRLLGRHYTLLYVRLGNILLFITGGVRVDFNDRWRQSWFKKSMTWNMGKLYINRCVFPLPRLNFHISVTITKNLTIKGFKGSKVKKKKRRNLFKSLRTVSIGIIKESLYLQKRRLNINKLIPSPLLTKILNFFGCIFFISHPLPLCYPIVLLLSSWSSS